MAFLIGTDEAGYGPNLGPLVVSATLWRVPDESLDDDLYELLADVVARESNRRDARLAIADSKQLYKPGGGLAALEQAVLAALRVSARLTAPAGVEGDLVLASPSHEAAFLRVARPSEIPDVARLERWREIWPLVDSQLGEQFASVAWYAGYDADLPCDAHLETIEHHASALFAGLAEADVELVAMRSRVVSEGRFNELVELHENKANVLSRVTLELVEDLLAPLGEGSILVHCDKHGGRNRYAPLLQRMFPEHLIEVRCEGRAQSIYRWGPRGRRIEIRFVAGGESALPAALASMLSKYLRELAMQAFNAFWLREVPGLKPTAGYPSDALRFHQSIAARQSELGIDDRTLWRSR
jgi:hypothetical protein